MKDELCRVSIKNRNMKASFASVKLLQAANLAHVMLMFLTTILFNMNK